MARAGGRWGEASVRPGARGGTAGVLVCALACLLSGCASLREAAEPERRGAVAGAAVGETALPPATTASAPADDESEAPPSLAPSDVGAAYRLVVDAPGEVRNLLQTYLDLGRFQGEADADRITAGELNRLIGAAPAQARSLLETEGFFNATVTVERQPGLFDSTPQVVVKVDPGPRARVERWSLNVQGELSERGGQGLDDAVELIHRLRTRWPLRTGEDFRQPAWTSAKNSALALLRAEGYPAASIDRTEARVDAATQQVEIKVVFDSGPRFQLGELRIEGLQRYGDSAVRNVADFGVGAPYTEKRLLDFQERLTKLGLFESVTVEIDTDPAAAPATPVIVRLREQTLQQATTGIGFSDNTGPRITLEHRHRRPFGLDLQSHNKFELGRDLRSWEGELITHPGTGQYRNLVAGSVSRLDAAGDVTVASRARIGRLLETERIERLVFGEVIRSVTTNGLGRRTSQAVSANHHWVWRGVDSVLLPTEGYTVSLESGAGYARSNFADSGPFGRLYGRVTGYWPIGRSWFSSLRVEGGQIFSRPAVGLPDALLFRAGGDDSVRGYGYRTLGPVVNGVLTSGRHLFTASGEIARPISAHRPSLWWAAFVDAGHAANKWSELDPVVGYGLGLRWRSPVGPLKLDVAYGADVHKTRLHLSVGIAF